MVTRQNTINMINFASDGKLTILVSDRVNREDYRVDGLDLEDLVTVLIAHFSNSPNIRAIERFISNDEIKGDSIDYVIGVIIEHFGQDEQFIANIEAINRQRTYLLEQANLLADGHPTLEHLVNLVEANDNYCVIDGIIRQYFPGDIDGEVIRWLLGREFGVDLGNYDIIAILPEDEVDSLITYIHDIVGEVNDLNTPLGIANRVINGVNIRADDSISEISTDEFISIMSPGVRPVIETDLALVDFDDHANHSSYKADAKENKYSSVDSKHSNSGSAFFGADSKVFYRGHFRDDEDFGDL